MNVRWLTLLLVVVGVGCAHAPRTAQSQTPKYEHVFQKPLSEAMDTARELLASKGYTFEETQDPNQLLTTWEVPDRPSTGTDAYSRYLVTGIAVGPRQSVVRIFRMSFHAVDNVAENGSSPWWRMVKEINYMTADPRFRRTQLARGGADLPEMRMATKGQRDLELEKALTLRLESNPSIEVVSGNIQQDPLPTPVRDEAFYLARWKDVDPKTHRCGDTVRGLSELFHPGLTLLIGEQLGSREAPAVVGNVVCQTAEAGHAVVLGLSIPRTEQERLERYLASPGAPVDQDALLEGRFWQRPYQDGRSSRAIFDLIDRVRAMRAAGLRVTLVAYDTDVASGSERDAALAKVWADRRAAHPDEVHVVLAGNTHTRTVAGTPWDQNFKPMASHLNQGRLVVLEMSYAQGTRWGCDLNRAGKLQCGYIGASPSERVAAEAGQTPFVRPFETPTPEGYHGLLYVGALTPSLPAVSKDLTPPPPSGIRPAPPMVEHPPIF
ncbi:hypothetical protein [Myxococcus sp. RHSTA-1-4]|uniref:hypothetical protein n=1 Tax=Myxococcus sp. RHSTA-1-4 TaxID=2874601 RepID=UPI001CBCE433|nr:hypothetical protein [Myxococcus sp. RHSTA-1-4]MBZ4415871.1 hypothetical protein [Myxococcus sp. RHSTA-1-4]